ncbi:TonB family protein [Xanthomonas floridensis]|uniref:Energy transducer TonB n=1 Tax=Xanthomonas floridensis TaxID=1843580 RepID=A0A1A9M7I2_9XANT|nr:TonB family protein [Xanthomonas floridensis]MEA5123040.1 TonB family protein [Xanthomonas floridensis]MEA5130544.1 TonB family protein [Xanthomonas floridensis]OAG66082.1 energy transducer TonB [Xanthomonas floridensis]
MSADAMVLRTTLYTSAAVLACLLLRGRLRAWLGPSAAYAIWASVPLALLAALLPGPPVGTVPLPGSALVTLPFAPGSVSSRSNWREALGVAWSAGVVLMALRVWRSQWRFVRSLGPLRALGNTLWVATHDVGLPASLGVRRPRIVLPPDFTTRYSADERALVLAHEQQHLHRGDLWANALAIALLCLGWFNPLLYMGWRAFRLDQELACDAAVMALHPGKRRSYATAMLKCQLGSAWTPLACHWAATHPLTQRLTALRMPAIAMQRARRNARAVMLLAAIASLACWVIQPARLHAMPVAGDPVDFSTMQPPRYPAAAVAARLAGLVELQIQVSPSGIPERIAIVHSQPAGVFDQSVLEAARGWRFRPASVDGRAVTSTIRVPVRFEPDPPEDASGIALATDGPHDPAQLEHRTGCSLPGCTAQETR